MLKHQSTFSSTLLIGYCLIIDARSFAINDTAVQKKTRYIFYADDTVVHDSFSSLFGLSWFSDQINLMLHNIC